MKFFSVIALILVLVGAINWGLVGVANFNFVGWLLGGDMSALSRLVYVLVGLSGIWGLRFLCRCKALCGCKAHGCKPDA